MMICYNSRKLYHKYVLQPPSIKQNNNSMHNAYQTNLIDLQTESLLFFCQVLLLISGKNDSKAHIVQKLKKTMNKRLDDAIKVETFIYRQLISFV